MTKVIVITSGKGGVGKTNISVNTAVELARRKRKICLFDADLGLANVNILLGVHPEKTLDDYLFGQDKLDDIILETRYGFDIIPGSSGIEEVANLPPERIAPLLQDFATLTRYDNFIIDTSSGISKGVISFCLAADETILIITAESTSLTDAYALLKVLAFNKYQGTVKILVNKCSSIPKSKETYLHFKTVANKHLDIEISVVGAIIHDPNLEKAVAKQQPVLDLYPESIASQCIRAMAINLLGSNEPKTAYIGDDSSSFWERYFSFLRSDLSSDTKSMGNHPTAQPAAVTTKATPIPSSSPPLKPPGRPPTTIRLETPAGILAYALELHAKGKLDRDGLVKIISCDPALTLKLIQLLKATLRNKVKPPARIDEIISLLGETEVAKWLINSAVQSALNQTPSDESQFLAKYWTHSYSTAVLAGSFAQAINYPAPEEAFLAGLLHNIGRMAYQLSAPELYILSPDLGQEEEKILETEVEFFTSNHAEFGATILNRYQLGSFIEDCAQYHTIDSGTVGTALPLTKLVYLAGKLWNGSELEKIAALGEPLLGIPDESIIELRDKAAAIVETTAHQFKISSNDITVNTKLESRLKKLARDHVMIQAILPDSPSQSNIWAQFQWLYSGMSLLFDLPQSICLTEEKDSCYLRVLGTPTCLDSIFAQEVEISLASKHSVIVKTFHSKETITANLENGKNLADQQILKALGAELLFCVPMVEKNRSQGVLVVGIEKHEMDRITDLQEQIKQFAQLATRLLSQQTSP